MSFNLNEKVKNYSDFIEDANKLESLSPEDRINWVIDRFNLNTSDGEIKEVVMTSSFGAQSAVLLHMVNKLIPNIPVILIDTGYLFKETYNFIDSLKKILNLNLKIYRSEMSPAWQEAKWGKLWEQGLEGIEKYNNYNKVIPLERALSELKSKLIISGIRRQQSSTRKNITVLSKQNNRLRIHPIIDWTDIQIGEYLVKNKLPYHPLWDEGYVSIGDWHTTKKLTDDLTPEDTRFFGLKRECGINEGVDFII